MFSLFCSNTKQVVLLLALCGSNKYNNKYKRNEQLKSSSLSTQIQNRTVLLLALDVGQTTVFGLVMNLGAGVPTWTPTETYISLH